MATKAITIHTDSEIHTKAKELFKKQGLSFENGVALCIESYIDNFLRNDPVILHPIADDEVTPDILASIEEANGLSDDDFVSFPLT